MYLFCVQILVRIVQIQGISDTADRHMLKFHLWSRHFVTGASTIPFVINLHYIRFLNAFIRTGLGRVRKFAGFLFLLLSMLFDLHKQSTGLRRNKNEIVGQYGN